MAVNSTPMASCSTDTSTFQRTVNLYEAMEEGVQDHRDFNHVDRKSMIGLSFISDQEAYDFYNLYGRTIGFSVRKNQMTRNKDKIITRRELTCSCEGKYNKKDTPVKKRADTRTGCPAMLEVRLNNKDGLYVIRNFREDHNHELEPLSSVHLLRSQRGFSSAQVQLVFKMREAGIGPAAIYAYFRAEAGGSEKVNFTRTDCNNLTQRRRAEFLKGGDANSLLSYFKTKKKENKSFYYSIITDDENRISGCFWCDAKSKVDFNFFGDVISFDTTFNTNNYGMICAPIAGVNNHGQTIIFGCGLLSNEQTDSFIWLFREFMEAMGGKHLEVIFTDQAQAIANAIKEVFPNALHRLCLWHIYLNATGNLSNAFKEDESFKGRLRNCIYNPETVEEFETWWNRLLEQYSLVENEWLKKLYSIKEKWAMVYARPHFCAGMTTTQRSESVNNFLKKFMPRTIVLTELVQQYEVVMGNRRDKELEVAKRKMPPLKTEWKVEVQASKFYTRNFFEEFQAELLGTIGFELGNQELSEDGTTITYPVKYSLDRRRIRKVIYVPSTQSVKCSCKKFEFTGVLCGHILKLLIHLQWSELPSIYLLNRWGKNAISGVVVDASGDVIRYEVDPALSARYSELSCIAQALVAKSTISVATFKLAKSELLEATKKVDFLLASQEQCVDKTVETSCVDNYQQTTATNIDDSAPNITLHNPVQKRKKGEQKGRKKSGVEKGGKRTRKSNDTDPIVGEAEKEENIIADNPCNTQPVYNAQACDVEQCGLTKQSQYGHAYQEYIMMNGHAYDHGIYNNSLTSFNSVQESIFPGGYTSSNIGFSNQLGQVYRVQDMPQIPGRRLDFGGSTMPNNFLQ